MPFDTFTNPLHPPVNEDLVDRIVSKLKAQGIFDQFRKDCLADVDTKPAYQNLQQRVNGTVAAFLGTQQWQPDLNKIQLRETLRRHVQQGYLEIGVDRIVDQVVNPKIFPVFMPKVEDVVCECLGIEKPAQPLSTTFSTHFFTSFPPPSIIRPHTSSPPPNTSSPPPNTSSPPPNTSRPPPNTSRPPPNTSSPPPNTSRPPPNTSSPPPHTSSPPPNTSRPPPNTSVPPPATAPADLLPPDLEPVSPGEADSSVGGRTPLQDEKDQELNDNLPSKETENGGDSQLSGISDLSSHGNHSNVQEPIAADSNTVKSIASIKQDKQELHFDNFTNLSEKIKQAEKTHGQVSDPHNANSMEEITSLNDGVKNDTSSEDIVETFSTNSLIINEDSKTFTSSRPVKEETCTFSDNSRSSTLISKNDVTLTPSKPILDSESSNLPLENPSKPVLDSESSNLPIEFASTPTKPILDSESCNLPLERSFTPSKPALDSESSNLPLEVTSTPTKPILDSEYSNLPLERSSTPSKPTVDSESSNLPLERSLTPSKPIIDSESSNLPLERSLTPSKPILDSESTNLPLERPLTPSKPILDSESSNLPLERSLTPSKPILDSESNNLSLERSLTPSKPVLDSEDILTPSKSILNSESRNLPLEKALTPSKPIIDSDDVSTLSKPILDAESSNIDLEDSFTPSKPVIDSGDVLTPSIPILNSECSNMPIEIQENSLLNESLNKTLDNNSLSSVKDDNLMEKSQDSNTVKKNIEAPENSKNSNDVDNKDKKSDSSKHKHSDAKHSRHNSSSRGKKDDNKGSKSDRGKSTKSHKDDRSKSSHNTDKIKEESHKIPSDDKKRSDGGDKVKDISKKDRNSDKEKNDKILVDKVESSKSKLKEKVDEKHEKYKSKDSLKTMDREKRDPHKKLIEIKDKSDCDHKDKPVRSEEKHEPLKEKIDDKEEKSNHNKDKIDDRKEKRDQSKTKTDDKDKRDYNKDKEKSDSNRDKHKSSRHKDDKSKSDKGSKNEKHDSDKGKSKDRHRHDSLSEKDKKYLSGDKVKDFKKRDDKSSRKSDDKSDKERKTKTSGSSKDKSCVEKKDDDRKDRKRKGGERCKDDIVKSKDPRRSSDRDNGGGGSRSSGRSENGHSSSSAQRASEGKSNKSSSTNGPQNQTQSIQECDPHEDIDAILLRLNSSIQALENAEKNQIEEDATPNETEISENQEEMGVEEVLPETIQETQPSEEPAGEMSEVDLILQKLNSSLEKIEKETAIEEESEIEIPVKKPKIANNFSEIRKIIQARKSIDRKLKNDSKNNKIDESCPENFKEVQSNNRIANEPKEKCVKLDQLEHEIESTNLIVPNKSFYGFSDGEIDKSIQNFLLFEKTVIYNRILESTDRIIECFTQKLSQSKIELFNNNLNKMETEIINSDMMNSVVSSDLLSQECFVRLEENCPEILKHLKLLTEDESCEAGSVNVKGKEIDRGEWKTDEVKRGIKEMIAPNPKTEASDSSAAVKRRRAAVMKKVGPRKKSLPIISTQQLNDRTSTESPGPEGTLETPHPGGVSKKSLLKMKVVLKKKLSKTDTEEGRLNNLTMESISVECAAGGEEGAGKASNTSAATSGAEELGTNSTVPVRPSLLTRKRKRNSNEVSTNNSLEQQDNENKRAIANFIIPKRGNREEDGDSKTQNKRLSRPSQRYSSSDLYKPRPVIRQLSKRFRASRSVSDSREEMTPSELSSSPSNLGPSLQKNSR